MSPLRFAFHGILTITLLAMCIILAVLLLYAVGVVPAHHVLVKISLIFGMIFAALGIGMTFTPKRFFNTAWMKSSVQWIFALPSVTLALGTYMVCTPSFTADVRDRLALCAAVLTWVYLFMLAVYSIFFEKTEKSNQPTKGN